MLKPVSKSVVELGLVLACALAVAGCQGTNQAHMGQTAGGGGGCKPGMASQCACSDGSTSTQLCGADGITLSVCQCGAADGGAPDGLGATVPCDVAAALQAKCWSCHGSTLNYTAPMHLQTTVDFQAPSHSDAKVPVYQQVKARIHSTQMPMPPATMPQLTVQELAVLDSWLDSGAHSPATGACQATAADAGVGSLPMVDAAVAADAGPTGPETCYDFVAHNPGTKDPYTLPTGTKDLYFCWSFPAPWQSTVQGTSFKSIITNTQVVHHWLLYQNVTAQTEGGLPCIGAHPDAALVAGWAVGGSDTIMPSDVGMQMGTAGYTLEIHYNNATPQDVLDRSGVKVCVTTEPRPHTAAVHWLGTTSLSLVGAGDVSSTCTPNFANGPITIINSWPHMHKHGVHMKSIIMRSNGQQDTLIDKPFDFNYQISYPTPMVLNPGDTVQTTCSYGSGPVSFGEGSDQEMCFNFVTAWPAGSLSSVGFSSLQFTANQCFN